MEVNSIGSQPPTLPTNPAENAAVENGTNLGEGVSQLDEAATTAFASVFFSMLQNILSEAQNNSNS